MLVLTGTDLRPSDVRDLAPTGPLAVVVAPDARARAADGHRRSVVVAARRQVYGRSTGVGANRSVEVDPDSREGHGARLLRSHAHGAGDELPERVVRASMLVRANQLARGHAGLRPELLDALVAALADGRAPHARRVGSLGTGDLALLAELGLALQGERPWRDGTAHRYLDAPFLPDDALPFLSSNAVTIALATLVTGELTELLHAAEAVGALSFIAMRGNAEAYAEEVHAARPHRGTVAAATRLRALVRGAAAPARLQDPYGLRCLPQLHGPAIEALDDLEASLAVELNAAVENPLFVEDDALHHGGFHNAQLAIGLDRTRLAMAQVAAASLARLTKLNDPAFTGQRAFLATGPAGSSGTMMIEYTAGGALADLRTAAAPTSLHAVVLSLGMEDHASFAWQGAERAGEVAAALRVVLGCELVAALRSLRLEGPERPIPDGLGPVAARAMEAVPHEPDDHHLTTDVDAAVAALPALAGLVASAP